MRVGCALGRNAAYDGCWWAVDGGGAVGRAGVRAGGLLDGVSGAAVLPARVASPREAPQR